MHNSGDKLGKAHLARFLEATAVREVSLIKRPTTDVCGQEPGDIVWDPNHFSNMGSTWDAHVSRLYRTMVDSKRVKWA